MTSRRSPFRLRRGWFVAFLAAALPTIPALAGTAPLDFDTIFAEHPLGRLPTSPLFSPDGNRLAFLWSESGDDELWLMDLPSGGRRALPTADGMAPPESFQWSPDGAQLLVVASGDLWLVDAGSCGARRLTETAGEEVNPTLSPDGATVAFSRDQDVHLLDLETREETRLTTDGERGRILNGTLSWVYWEELWERGDAGLWWSPDGRRLAFYRFDESEVSEVPLPDAMPIYPEVTWQRYPKAGQTNPTVRVGVLDLASGETTWMRAEAPEETYLARVHWRPGDDGLAIERLHRGQDRLDLLSCDPDDGACTTLLTEEWPTWVNLGDETTFLDDGRILWSSERSGWKRLYRLGDDGGLEPLTPDDLVVTSLDRVGDGWIHFTAFRRDTLGAAHRSVHRLSLEDGRHVELAGGDGWHQAQAVGAAGYWVHTWSDFNTPPRADVRDADGRVVAELPATAPLFDASALPRWRLLKIPGTDGEPLPAQILEPATEGPPGPGEGGRHPVIMYHYGGPGSQVVADRWPSRERFLWHKMMAQRGFGVLYVDNPGSIFFGKRGEDRLHRRFGEVNLAAQRAGVAYLETLPWADPEALGLWGWSGGGANTLYSVLASPGTWAAAIAGAPVTDWRLYDTLWTERYLDHPDENPEGYELSSAVTHAANLRDPLLIVHGTADDNVHPQNTLVMSRKLIESNRPFDQALYPGQKHGLRGPDARHFHEKATAFFTRHLAPKDQPRRPPRADSRTAVGGSRHP